ncbi:hypothetical protein V7S43_002557 [Phytophthora oleae]|uniref:PiggyBac transposable element-derived protein 4 C-terminal zinc-ribbon domain-containing protein n=1 Tax=Phytophthora oleae TaxID=2107226 RepID=A0ABD3G1Y7_9STRA
MQTLSPGQPTEAERLSAVPTDHKLTMFPDWDRFGENKKHRKRPQHQCKDCSLRKRKVGERCASRFYCAACSTGKTRVYLCDRVRPNHYPWNTLTCFQIWHVKWKNGSERSRPLVGRDIQMRGLGKKRRRPSASDEEKEAEEQNEGESE